MRLIGRSEVTTVDEPHVLEFVMTREDGLLETLASPLLSFLFLFMAWCDKQWFFVGLSGITFAYWAANRLNGNVSKVSVSDREIVVTTNVKKFPNRQMRFKHRDIDSLGYWSEGEGGPSGLFLNRTCILQGLEREEADAIARQLFSRFPNMGSVDHSLASLLHGDDSGITTLGLNSHTSPKPSSRETKS